MKELSNKEIRRFAQTLKKNLNLNLDTCIDIIKMMIDNKNINQIDQFILNKGEVNSITNVSETCLVDVNSETNIMIGKHIYYNYPKDDNINYHTLNQESFKVGELKYINDKPYFEYDTN